MRKSTIITAAATIILAASVSAQTADVQPDEPHKARLTVVQQAVAVGLNINPNTAPLDSLDMLPGIGKKKAQAIIDYRASIDGLAFTYVDDMPLVKGIGPKTVAKIAPFVSLPSAPVENN